MHIEQHVDIGRPAEAVWAALEDVALIADCIPGATLAESHANDRFTGWLSVKVGPVAAKFQVEVEIKRDRDSLSGTVEGRGVDKMTSSQARARARYWLTALDDGATRVSVAADVSLTGVLGQFASSSVVTQIALRLADGFASNISARLTADSTQRPPVATEKAPLSVGPSMADLWRTFLNRVRRALRLATPR